jgi:hypothetical protein
MGNMANSNSTDIVLRGICYGCKDSRFSSGKLILFLKISKLLLLIRRLKKSKSKIFSAFPVAKSRKYSFDDYLSEYIIL